MSQVRELHEKAMRLARLALVAREHGDIDQAEELARQALDFEASAADLIVYSEASEPTRSILYRSAASLAIQCKEFGLAIKLVAKGLSGYPPKEIELELKGLYEQANFEDHLRLRNVVLEEDDFQLSMAGDAVGFGTILYSEFIRRIENVSKIIDRTVQRLMQRDYQQSGRVAQIYKPFTPALSVPREGSFAITFKLLREGDQQLSLFVDAAQVIDEVLNGIELINNQHEDSLRQHIHSDSYYRQFISLTKDTAPDGKKISFVGFTSSRRSVGLTRSKDHIDLLPDTPIVSRESERTPIKVTGVLDYASSRDKDVIGLTAEDDKHYAILVEEGMDDYVRSYFKQIVSVTGQFDGANIHLSEIKAID